MNKIAKFMVFVGLGASIFVLGYFTLLIMGFISNHTTLGSVGLGV